MKKKLKEQYIQALTEKNTLMKEALSMINSNIRNKEIELKREIKDEEVFTLITKEIKQLKETLSYAEKGNREQIIVPCKYKIEFLEAFLPKLLSENEVINILTQLYADNPPENKGEAMKLAMGELKGKADNSVISACVIDILNKK